MNRVGIIGLGRHGRRYAEHLRRGDVPGATLGGFWRRDPERARADAEALGTPDFESIPALLEAVEAVVVAIPAPEHPRVARMVAAAGRPLLLEKPLAVSVAEAEGIEQAFAGGRLMVAQTLRFDPLVERVRALIHDGALGPVRGLELHQRLEPRGLAWELSPETAGGGVLLQTGIHGVDTLRFVVGARSAEVTHAALDHVHGHASEDVAWVLLRLDAPTLPGPTRASAVSSKIGGSRHHALTVFGDAGAVEADLIARTLTFTEGRTRRVVPVPEAPTVVRTLTAFVEWLARGEGPAPVPAEDARASLALVEAAYRLSGRASR